MGGPRGARVDNHPVIPVPDARGLANCFRLRKLFSLFFVPPCQIGLFFTFSRGTNALPCSQTGRRPSCDHNSAAARTEKRVLGNDVPFASSRRYFHAVLIQVLSLR